MRSKKLYNDLAWAEEEAHEHADKCRKCFVPIVDEEGNPKYLGEACAEGRAILQRYIDAEKVFFGRIA